MQRMAVFTFIYGINFMIVMGVNGFFLGEGGLPQLDILVITGFFSLAVFLDTK